MHVSARSTISANEDALRTLRAANYEVPLRLPTNIRHVFGGGEAALTQVIITWAQHNAGSCLQTYISDDTQIDDFVRRLPGLTAALCAHEANAKGETESVIKPLRLAALSRLDQLQSADPKASYRGQSAEIVCADHLGRNSPYLLYTPDRLGGTKLRPRENFRDLALWLLKGAIPKEYRPNIDTEAAEAIGSMLFETFKNTEGPRSIECLR